MIKENEIRVGNYVKGTAMGLIHKIDLHFFNECYDDETMLDWYSPIRLTEQILVDCDFKNTEVYQKSWYFNNAVPINIHLGKIMYNDMSRQFEIKSLHQLQNLYFTLTGEELECKNAIPKNS